MHKVLVAGSGKIGTLIALLLIEAGDYEVHLIDKRLDGVDCIRLKNLPNLYKHQIDITKEHELNLFIENKLPHALISSLPYFCNKAMATLAKRHNIHYFDLTEDIETTRYVKEIAKEVKKAFVPQCGLAPGFISIVTHHLMQQFELLHSAKLRVGALPQSSSNILQYSLTWSTDGLINEYGNPCLAIVKGNPVYLEPLEDVELLQIDGLSYEAFNTSGGIGSLAELYAGKIKTLNYKTVRYPGHCAKMRFLMKGLHLNSDRPTLKRILENVLPKTYQDVVVIYSSVTGIKQGELIERCYVHKIYPQTIGGYEWSAIQVCTASSIATVVDLILSNPEDYPGYVYQEKINFDQFLANRFGRYYLMK